MGTINPQVPTVGQPNSTEDPKIASAITTIRDAINGELDDDNIAASADINGSKLLNASVATAKIADDAVTAAKIATGVVGSTELAALSVLSGKIPLTFQSNKGSDSTTAGAAVRSSVASVLPGTYLVVAQVATDGIGYGFSIGYSGGAATITQPTSPFDVTHPLVGTSGNYVSGLQVGQAVVTTTTTIELTATRFTGTQVGSLYIFGITAA
jgi:dihydroxyacetone kinase DhaKLM complex PTS-EIIA-like component DhaM